MAIYHRERHFQSIINDLDVETIPIRFIKDVTCDLRDGTTVVLQQEDLKGKSLTSRNIEAIVKDLDFFDMLEDLKIRIDFEKVEVDVVREVSDLLDQKDQNDQSDISV